MLHFGWTQGLFTNHTHFHLVFHYLGVSYMIKLPQSTVISQKKNITDFYAIRCLKTQFLTHTNPESVISETHHIFRTVFFIPPVPTLLELAGMGEFFHGRSKVFLPERDNSQEKFVSGIVHCPFSRLPSFLVVFQ